MVTANEFHPKIKKKKMYYLNNVYIIYGIIVFTPNAVMINAGQHIMQCVPVSQRCIGGKKHDVPR